MVYHLERLKRNILSLLVVGLAAKCFLSRIKRRRMYWVKPWIGRRQEKGILNLVNSELLIEDPACYKNYLRMTNMSFCKLLSKIEDKITKQDTTMRECVPAKHKLMITLRLLATGESFRNLMYSSRIHESTISLFVPEVCKAIYLCLKEEYMKVPSTEEEWSEIATKFEKYWNISNTIGAIDGKHVAFRAPRNVGSTYFNYKGFHSVVLLAVADANYRFLYVDVGVNGRVSDGGVFMQSSIFKALELKKLNIPPDKPLPGRNLPVPHVLLADAAFPLKSYIMKPFPIRNLTYEQRIYNYRVSRARRVIENAFGILSNRFRIFLTTISLSPEKVKYITLASCTLHNFLLAESPIYKEQTEENINSFHMNTNLSHQSGNRTSTRAIGVREEFLEYFNTNGAVPWQDRMV